MIIRHKYCVVETRTTVAIGSRNPSLLTLSGSGFFCEF